MITASERQKCRFECAKTAFRENKAKRRRATIFFTNYSLIAPSVIPLVKYGCKNGYTIMMGSMAQMMVAMRSAMGGGSCAPISTAPVRISANAAREAPSKMGYPPSTILTLDDAIKIIMVKSANDVATSIGLSPNLVQDVFQTLIRLRDQGVTILMVEQNAKAALAMSDYGLVLELGQTRMFDKADKLLKDPRVGQLFLGGHIEDAA